MTYVGESYLDSAAKLNLLVIGTGHKTFDGAVSVFHGVYGFSFYAIASFSLTIAPLSFLHLNVSTVTKHYAAEICTCLGCIYASSESLGI